MTATDPRLPYRELSDDFLAPRDPVLGYIKVGGRSPTIRYTSAGKPWVVPIRFLDPARFEVCTREKRTKKVDGRGNASGQEFTVDLGYVRDEDFHALKGVGQAPSSLRIRLLYPTWNQNLIAFLGAYGGGKWVCRGNGVEATDIKRGACVCPCPRLIQFSGTYEGTSPTDSYVCKPHAQLNVLLEDAGVFGGFWAFKTTSYETISNLIKSLQMFEEMFGRLDGLPLELRVMAVTKQLPDGGTTTQPIVALVLAASMATARQVAADAAAESRKYLPAGGKLDETKYLAAVVSEMETEAGTYADEFMPAEVIEDDDNPNQEGEDEVDDNLDGPEGDRGEVQTEEGAPRRREQDDRGAEALPARRGDVDHNERDDHPGAGDRGKAQVPEAVGDSDRNDPEGGPLISEKVGPSPEPKTDDRELATKVLTAAGWDEAAVRDRVRYHEATHTLGKLLDRLERGEPLAWAKVTTPDLFEGEPEDGLES